MKRIIKTYALIMALIMAALSLAACGKKTAADIPQDAVLPPARVPLNSCYYELERDYSFADAYREADGVYLLTIGDWLSEDENYSFYKAIVESAIKGENKKEIVVVQNGNSLTGASPDCGPLFTYGNKLLLFLDKVDDSNSYPYEPRYDDMYHILGVYITVCSVVRDKNGEQYVFDTEGIMSGYDGCKLKNYSNDSKLMNELKTDLFETDPFWKMLDASFDHVYKLDELAEYLSAVE